MFRGEDIKQLVRLLETRGVSLFHACQFEDFKSYLSLEGIPSRACMVENKRPFTQFETDGDDHTKGVWDKVFMNFSDFGKTFAKEGGKGVPNPYGPILLQINPSVLLEATDVAICFQPVGGSNFNRETCALKKISDVDRLFAYPVEDDYPRSSWPKYQDALRKEFQCTKVCDPDISCTVIGAKLSLKQMNGILVDPYTIGGKPLRMSVADLVSRRNLRVSVQERSSKRKFLYNELICLIERDVPSCFDLSQSPDVSEGLRSWAQSLINLKLDYQFNRFASYLRDGTLLQLI
jgi:hypothetical protein